MRRTATFAAAAAALAGATCLSAEAGAVTVPCSNANLNGAYSVTLKGYVGRFPLSAAGILFLDGNGNVTAASVLSYSRDFNVFQNIGASGTYQLNSNCTGAMTLNVNLGTGVQHFDIAVNSSGFVGIQTDFNTSVTLDAKP